MILGHNVTRVRELKRTRPIVIKGKEVKNARSLWTFEAYETGVKVTALAANLIRHSGVARAVPRRLTLRATDGDLDRADGRRRHLRHTVEDTHNFVAEGLVLHNSGFTQAIYQQFGIHAPRTSEAQYAWAKVRPSARRAGLLHRPAGGPPPGHVAIVRTGTASSPRAARGWARRCWPCKFLPLMGTGVPKGGFPKNSGGGGNAAIGGPSSASAGQAQAYARSRLSAYGWGAAQWPPLQNLWQGESGWNRLARNPGSGAYGIPQALPASKMGRRREPPTSSAAAQINWGLGYIKNTRGYGSPSVTYAKWLGRQHPHWYGEGGLIPGMAGGGSVPGYAAGGPVTPAERAGQTWLNAWRSKRGGGFGAAWGPVVVNEQIELKRAAIGRETTLSHATGLSAGQHKFWASAAATDTKKLAVLNKELTTERTWRGQLGSLDVTLARDITAAKGVPRLAGNVTAWKKDITANQYTIGQISKMLGFSAAQIAAMEKAGKLGPGGRP